MSRPGGTISCVPRSATDADHSVLVLDLRPSPAQAHRLDQALVAAGDLRRVLTHFGLARPRDLRQSPEWRAARALPTGLDAKGKVVDAPARKARNEALNAARTTRRLSERDFEMVALELRRESHWIAEHVPSSSALAISHEVWEVFERHLFAGGGRALRHARVGDGGRGSPQPRPGGRESSPGSQARDGRARSRALVEIEARGEAPTPWSTSTETVSSPPVAGAGPVEKTVRARAVH